MKTISFAHTRLRWRILTVLLAPLFCGALRAESGDTPQSPDGWKGVSPRDEIRPAFEIKRDGGPARKGSLIIRSDDREGLDGHWVKTFFVQSGQF